MYIEKPCKKCGVVFKTYLHLKRRETKKFCSKKCYWESMAKSDLKGHKCEICNKEFFVRPTNILKGYRSGRFCSIKCYNTGKSLYLLDKSHNWKGGRHQTETGYVLLRVGKHHLADSRGYAPEHRVIMERYLKRPLLEKEVVHHINHIKNDNRIENLMLLNGQSEHLAEHRKKPLSSENN